MIVTTCIDLPAKAYRFFLHKAQESGITPEDVISGYLEAYAINEIEKHQTFPKK